MRIAIVTTQVPFIKGGAEEETQALNQQLINHGHNSEIITMPFVWYPPKNLLNSILAGRMFDLSTYETPKIDLVIALKFPAYYVQHPNKVILLLHQHRQAYELWADEVGDLAKYPRVQGIRKLIFESDTKYLSEAKKLFTNSQTISNRLKKYNGLDSEAIYHPPPSYKSLRFKSYENFIFYPSRIDSLKRQWLLVEAARYLKSDLKIVFSGSGDKAEIDKLKNLIKKYSLGKRVELKGFISEEEKIDLYARCLAVYFGAYAEDYGYITLEGFLSKKAVVVHPDAGGPLEFITDKQTGFVVDPDPKLLAACLDNLAKNKQLAKKIGNNGYDSYLKKNISWDHVVKKLTS